MIGMEIIPHALTSASRILLSMLSLKEYIESFVELVYLVANHSYHLLQFLVGIVILFLPRKGEGLYSSKWHCLNVLGEGVNSLNHISN